MHLFDDDDDLGPEITLTLPQDVVENMLDVLRACATPNNLEVTSPGVLIDEIRFQLNEQLEAF